MADYYGTAKSQGPGLRLSHRLAGSAVGQERGGASERQGPEPSHWRVSAQVGNKLMSADRVLANEASGFRPLCVGQPRRDNVSMFGHHPCDLVGDMLVLKPR